MEKEIWKAIPTYIGYEASNLGRVRSLDREVTTSNSVRKYKGLLMSQSIIRCGSAGYLSVSLNKVGKRMTHRVHQLVAMAFLGHVPNGHDKVVDHIDGDRLNNNVNNLQVITQRENSSKDKRGGSSKYVGVTWCKPNKKWRAQINIDGKVKYLGDFTNEIDASEAYQNYLKEILK